MAVGATLVLALVGCGGGGTSEQQASPATSSPQPQPSASPALPPPATSLANAQIAGFVFEDKDRNGKYDGGDVLMASQTVLVTNPSASKRIKEVTTDASGTFGFAGLGAGEYRVSVQIPKGYERTNDDSMTLNVKASQAATQVQFGIAQR